MSSLGRFFASRWGPILTGIAVGVLAPILVKLGNPGNMGICVACFSRDIAGALGLHRAAPVQVIRPEIIGFVLGSLAAALLFREFRPRTGSAPLARFLLGMAAVIGALVFLGCPWRAYLRLGGGDWNAIFGREETKRLQSMPCCDRIVVVQYLYDIYSASDTASGVLGKGAADSPGGRVKRLRSCQFAVLHSLWYPCARPAGWQRTSLQLAVVSRQVARNAEVGSLWALGGLA
jgi:hypothetical protein